MNLSFKGVLLLGAYNYYTPGQALGPKSSIVLEGKAKAAWPS